MSGQDELPRCFGVVRVDEVAHGHASDGCVGCKAIFENMPWRREGGEASRDELLDLCEVGAAWCSRDEDLREEGCRIVIVECVDAFARGRKRCYAA